MSKEYEKTKDRCPNCGFCPHCGQSKRPPVIPAPYPVPVPVRPWRPAYPYWGEVTYGGESMGVAPRWNQTVSTKTSYEAVG